VINGSNLPSAAVDSIVFPAIAFGFPLLFIVLLVIPQLFPQANIIENFVMPPFLWAQGFFLAIAEFVAGG